MIAQAVTPTTADTELVVRALSGREDGFEELVRRYQRPIVAYVYRMVGDYDAALDLAQEVFIKVYNSLGRYRAEFKFSTWIYRNRGGHGAASGHGQEPHLPRARGDARTARGARHHGRVKGEGWLKSRSKPWRARRRF
jgi:hypothetical protein